MPVILSNGELDRQAEWVLIVWSRIYATVLQRRAYIQHLAADRRHAFHSKDIKVWN